MSARKKTLLPIKIMRRGGRGSEENDRIFRDGSWESVTRSERNFYLARMAGEGASLRSIQSMVTPSLSVTSIAKIIKFEGVESNKRGRAPDPIMYLVTGIAIIDGLRYAASTTADLTIAQLIDGTGLSDWAVRELIVRPTEDDAASRGTIRQLRSLVTIARSCGQLEVSLSRPRKRTWIDALQEIRAVATRDRTWDQLAELTNENSMYLRRLLAPSGNAHCLVIVDRIAAFFGYEIGVTLRIT